MSGFEGGTAPGVNGPRLADGGGGRKLRRNLKESVVGEVVREETTTHSQRLLGKRLQTSLLQNHRAWDQNLLQNCPWGSPRQVPEPSQAASGELWASPGRLCESCLAAPSPPYEPLTPSWHCLDASKSHFGCLSTLNMSFVEVLGPKF